MLSIIIPTYNEKKNIAELIDRIRACTENCEIIIVDDNSPDGTADFARKLGATTLVRPEKLGLASAVIDGFKVAKGDILCVMDADLSHPPEIIPQMLEAIKSQNADFVVGSRLAKGGGQRDWSLLGKFLSDIARLPAMLLTDVKDVTSGFFMLKRSVIQGIELNPIGFKICLEIITKGKYAKAVEVPIIFANRGNTKSKLGIKEILEYYGQVGLLYKDRLIGKLKNRREK